MGRARSQRHKRNEPIVEHAVADIGPPFEFPEGEGRIYNGKGQLFVRYYPGPENQLILEPYQGEMDVYSAPSFRELLIEAINNRYFQLVISLDHIEFLDSTGLGVLVGALKRVRAHDGYLDLSCSQERILKIFRITGLTKVYAIFPSILEALVGRRSQENVDLSPERIDQEVQAVDWIPVRLYMADAQYHERVEVALRTLIEEFGLEINYEFPPSYGSYWREFGARFRNRSTHPDIVDERMIRLEHAMRLNIIDQRQSAIGEPEAKAVTDLIAALEGTANAVIQIGTVILIKADDTILLRNLSQVELFYYERDPSSFRDPKLALRALQDIAALRKGHAHGRHPKTGTVHLARTASPPTSGADGELIIFAECGRTTVPLLLVADSTISCGSCRHMAIRIQT